MSQTVEDASEVIAIHGVTPDTLDASLGAFGAPARTYAAATGFKAEPGQLLLVPTPSGEIGAVLFGVEPAGEGRRGDPFHAGKLATALPPGTYRLADGFADPLRAAIAFELSLYRFDRFRAQAAPRQPHLLPPDEAAAGNVALIAGSVAWGRDLINRPANDLGPDAFEAAIREFAAQHGASCSTIVGDELLARDLPLIHAVGRAAAEPPRLVNLGWGQADAPRVTLVGKGVCFDTGGLDIKPSSGMALMKKDMGGAAAALTLAAMIIGANLRVRLRVLVPIVENAIAGNAFRPGDILRSRKGLSVEIGNTDAEGRLILADALALADEDEPELLLDFATLTGAARVALGPDLPPFYTDSEILASDIARHAEAAADPVWRLPLWQPYDKLLASKVADLNNISGGPFAGSITAALFLRRFVTRTRNWAHFDIYGWNPKSAPGRPEGGEIQAARALFAYLGERYGVSGAAGAA